MGSNEQQYGHFISLAKMRLCFNENSRLKRRKYKEESNSVTAWKLLFSKADHMNKCKVVVIVSDSLPFILLCLFIPPFAFLFLMDRM